MAFLQASLYRSPKTEAADGNLSAVACVILTFSAVYSACNTDSGKLVKGEGIMSLSRGFIHAGCPSVVMSLWSVNDGSTSDIMKRFYQNLSKGKSKDSALKQAKLDYLNSSKKAFQHPFYWAAFVQFGDTSELRGNAFFSLKKLAIGGVLLFVVFFFIQKIRKTN